MKPFRYKGFGLRYDPACSIKIHLNPGVCWGEGAKHLDALGWLKQLDFRKKCLTFFHDSVVEKSVAIPNRVMAEAIFLPGECGEETVRKQRNQ